ncbi:DUF4913 domain-containing protein [Actinosynnema sp. NPDC059335]|uniref:DUF4913 domain-containing protein n=1 Tax=Actinosynnema sp. NPDC059335 TaxID=3346804 RepID=UPI00366B729F
MTTPPRGVEERDESAEDIRQDEERVGRPAELFYPHVAEFVTDRLIYLIPRPTPESRLVWCPSWFRHAQALSRLDSVWRAWESLRFDPALGMANWWTHYADPHLRALMDPVTGPFARCVDGHRSDEPLPVDLPPEGLFTDQRNTWNLPFPDDPLALD